MADAAEDDRPAGPTAGGVAPGDLVELTPTRVAHGGVFVARHASGRVVLVADTLPDERVLARIGKVKKRFATANTVEVLEPSPERRPHIWPEAGVDRDPDARPGGAEFGHIALPFQRELKRRVLAEALQRFGGVDAFGDVDEPRGAVEAAPGDDEAGGLRWRTRVTLHFDEDGHVGPFAAGSHRIIEVASLPLAFADLEELAPLGGVDVRGPGQIRLVAPSQSDSRLRIVAHGEASRPVETITEVVAGHEFAVSSDGFWQVHRAAAAVLYDAVREAAASRFDPDARNLDLYGGVGLFAVALGDLGGESTRVTSVEAYKAATERAAANLASWPTAAVVTARVDRFLRGLSTAGPGSAAPLASATVVLDPPRSGAGRGVIERLSALGAARLVYVACDPVALARDAGILRGLGYALTSIRAFDLFPHTHHVEAVAVFDGPPR